MLKIHVRIIIITSIITTRLLRECSNSELARQRAINKEMTITKIRLTILLLGNFVAKYSHDNTGVVPTATIRGVARTVFTRSGDKSHECE